MEKNESSDLLFLFNLFHSFITHHWYGQVLRGEGGVPSMKHKVHEAIKHAPDCLIVRPNLSQSQSETKVRNRDGRERGEK